MVLVIVGLLLVALKLAAYGPVAEWSWWLVLAPFAGAAVWWHFADSSGWTKKRAMDKMEQRKADRRERAMADLGLGTAAERRRAATRESTARRRGGDGSSRETGGGGSG